MISTRVGESIPPNTKHAVSVCLPTWEATVGYEEADPEVVNSMTTGYPRFFIHKSVQRLCEVLTDKYAKENETCLCFPTYKVAKRCREYIRVKSLQDSLPVPKVRILQLATSKPITLDEARWKKECKIAVVFADKSYYQYMKQYWQHTGEIISSRLAEYVLHELFIVEKSSKTAAIEPSEIESKGEDETRDKEEFIETRYGRNLNFAFGDRAKMIIKKRIATKVANVAFEDGDGEAYDNYHLQNPPELHNNMQNLDLNSTHNGNRNNNTTSTNTATHDAHDSIASTIPAEPIDVENDANDFADSDANSFVEPIDTRRSIRLDSERDIFLFPSGMASIFTAHRLLLHLDARRVHRSRTPSSTNLNGIESGSGSAGTDTIVGYGNPYKKTVMFGFPYTDTLSILRKFNHTHFLGNGDSSSMEELEQILSSGEQILAVFMEAPSNPLLKMGDLIHLKKLSDIYGFYIVVDETAGGFVNIDVLPYADIVCSSLTKIFSGDSNVIAGSLVLNPQGKLYSFAQSFLNQAGEYEDCLWCEDAIYLERNSRDFVARTIKVNHNTEYLLKNVLIPQEGKDKLFKKIFYPSLTSVETKKNYDLIRCKPDNSNDEGSGYGGLFSLTFFDIEKAKIFFNNLKLCKGPSLGTNFTLACPYAVLAHYQELDEVAKYGVEKNLVRVSVGLENKDDLVSTFQYAIDKALEA